MLKERPLSGRGVPLMTYMGTIRLLRREEPDILDFCHLRQLESILDINAEVAHGAFDLCVTE
jgi:hypothetical protein